MLMKIKGYYPASLNGMNESEAEWTIETWAEMFEPYDVKHVSAALEYVVKNSTSSFPPSIGAIIQQTEIEMKRPKPFTGKVITMGTPEHKAFLEEQAKKKNGLQ